MSEQLIVIDKPFELEPLYKKEMCSLWKVSLYHLNRMLKAIETEIGEPVAGQYQVPQLEIFIKHYGIPGTAVKLSK